MDAQKNELESTVQKLLADGMSMDEILGKFEWAKPISSVLAAGVR